MFNAPATPSVTSPRTNVFLYADDDPDDCVIVSHMIERLCKDLDVQSVADGAEAIEWLAGRGVYADRNAYPLPDLLITDLRMPRKNGFDLMRWVRSQPEVAHLPIVVYSDSLVDGVANACKELGANHYISKAHYCHALREFVRNYMAAHGLRENGSDGTRQSPTTRF
jgi:CheY-like chemotaxis protein